jgi:multimeric flavodoxin WrbA
MNVVVLHGSARRGGDSDTLADRFLAGMGGPQAHEILHFCAIDMRIAHCRSCGACGVEDGGGTCVLRDDMQEVYPAFSEAHVVILAAPMFWGYMTSQLKTLFDRLEAIASPKHFGGKDFVLFVTYRHYYGSTVEWLQRITSAFGSRLHSMTCQTYDPETDRDVPIANFPGKLREAFELGRRVASGPGGV